MQRGLTRSTHSAYCRCCSWADEEIHLKSQNLTPGSAKSFREPKERLLLLHWTPGSAAWMLFKRESKAASAPGKGQDCPGMLEPWVSGEIVPCEYRSLWVSPRDETKQQSQDELPQRKKEKKSQPQRGMLSTQQTAKIKEQI